MTHYQLTNYSTVTFPDCDASPTKWLRNVMPFHRRRSYRKIVRKAKVHSKSLELTLQDHEGIGRGRTLKERYISRFMPVA